MDEILSLQEARNEAKVGSKARSLAKVYDSCSVPKGFVVTDDAFKRYLEENGLKDKILSILSRTRIEDENQLEKASRKIRSLFDNTRMADDLEEKVEEAYKDFVISSEAKKAGEKAMELIKAGREKPPVVVRASPTRNGNSSAGIYRSELNVKGDENLIEEVKKVWKSFYTPEAIYYREKRGYGHDATFGVLVQKMIEADKTVSFLERSPSDPQKFILEGVHGLGKLLSDGEILPDVYFFDRSTSRLKNKEIAEKRWVQQRNPSTGNIEKQPIKSSKKGSEVLTNKEVSDVRKEAKKIASNFSFTSLVEFCIKNDEIFLLDVSPLEVKDGGRESPRGEVISSGFGVSPGRLSGKITRNGQDSQSAVRLTKIASGKSLLMSRPEAVIASSGGFSSNGSKMARELEVPMIVRAGSEDGNLREGRSVSIDAFEGEVLGEEREKESLSGGGEMSFESGTHEAQDYSESVTATELLVSIDSSNFREKSLSNARGIVFSPGTSSFRHDRFGGNSDINTLRRSSKAVEDTWVKTDLSEESVERTKEMIRKLQSGGKNKINLLASVGSTSELEKLKKNGSTGASRKGVIIKTPLLALSSERIRSSDLDMILIDFDKLVNRIFGSSEEKNVLKADPFWEMIDELCEKCESGGIDICVTGNIDRKIVKRLIKSGIDSILVEPENVEGARNMLARAEKKLLLEGMR